MSNIPKDFNDLSIYSKAYILGKEIGKRARTEHYDFSQGFDLKTRDELIKTCRILNNHDIFGGTIYKLAMKSSLFKNIAENSKYKPLKIFSKIDITAEDTDFSRAINYSNRNNDQYWVKREYEDGYEDYITHSGESNYTYNHSFNIGTRPILQFDLIENFCSNLTEENGILKFEFGDYPQDVVSQKEAEILETLFSNNELEFTDRKFSINNENISKENSYDSIFYLGELDEFELNGKKFVRVLPKVNNIFKNGEIIKKDKPVWIEVKPIKWLADKEDGIAISEKILFSGVGAVCLQSFFQNCFIDEILQNKFFKLKRVDQDFLTQYIKHESKRK